MCNKTRIQVSLVELYENDIQFDKNGVVFCLIAVFFCFGGGFYLIIFLFVFKQQNLPSGSLPRWFNYNDTRVTAIIPADIGSQYGGRDSNQTACI